MIRTALSLVLIALSFQTATAQLEPWHIVHRERVGNYHYIFSAIDSWSECFVVSGIEVDDSMPRFSAKVQLKFWRSNDAGLTWSTSVPAIGPWKGENTLVRSIQMIDSLNIVAVGDSGLFLRSTDGGANWSWKHLDTGQIHQVHFSDAMTGVIVEWKSDKDLATTTNGGNQWKWLQVDSYHPGWYWPWQAESLGGNEFRAISYAAGPLYYTKDNWESIDRSRLVLDTSDQFNIIRNFRVLGRDTLIAYGPYYDGKAHRLSLLRSTNGGSSWRRMQVADTVILKPELSQLDRPYVLLAGTNGSVPRYIGISVDSGQAWTFQQIEFDSTPPYFSSEASLVQVTPSGVALGIFGSVVADNYVEPSFLARTVMAGSHVEDFERIVYHTFLFPNPTATTLTIQSVDHFQPILVYDILGHEVLRGKLDGAGHAQFDVSTLPRGVYSVILKHNGVPLPIGKVAVVAR